MVGLISSWTIGKQPKYQCRLDKRTLFINVGLILILENQDGLDKKLIFINVGWIRIKRKHSKTFFSSSWA
jgi:hypothetical protein